MHRGSRLISSASRPKLYVCSACRFRGSTQLRKRFLSSTRPLRDEIVQTAKYAHLSNRALIRLAGPDAANFLHNIIPAKILGVGTNPVYTAFLSAQGRILSDVFIYPPSWDGDKHEWFIEVHEKSVGELLKHLRKHKLRSKFKLERITEGSSVFYAWPGKNVSIDTLRLPAGGQDPRPGMGTRLIVNDQSKDQVLRHLSEDGAEEVPLQNYTIHRMVKGLAEGPDEVIPGSALPQESNIDFMGGIDYHKGCYLGQELTIRTHHTGVVRKRILPVQLHHDGTKIPRSQTSPECGTDVSPALPPSGTKLKLVDQRGRSPGKWLDGVGNLGLALCRLEAMTDIQLTAGTRTFSPEAEYGFQVDPAEGEDTFTNLRLQPFAPKWLRDGVEQSLKRKEKKPRKQQEEDEEDEFDISLEPTSNKDV